MARNNSPDGNSTSGYPNGKTRREIFALAGKPLPDPVVRAEWSHFVGWFFELSRFRGDHGLQPATIRDWGESQGISFEPWEYDIIYKMDDEYRRGQSEVMADIRNQSKR